MYPQLWLCKVICMPTYNYYCNDCGTHFSYFQKMSESPISNCENCGGKVKRLITGGTGLIFKGSGFYLTDYKNSQKSTDDNSKSNQKKNENSKPVEKENNKTTADDLIKKKEKKTDE